MSDIPPAGHARGDTNGRQKQSGTVLVQLDGKASFVVVSQRSTNQPFDWRCGDLDREQSRRLFDEGMSEGFW